MQFVIAKQIEKQIFPVNQQMMTNAHNMTVLAYRILLKNLEN